MANRDDYLQWLADLGFDESEILPVFPVEDLEQIVKRRAHARRWLLDLMMRALITGDQVADQFFHSLLVNANVLVAKMFEKLANELKACGVDLPPGIFAGVLPLPTLNGAARRVSDGALILVDNGTFQVVEAALDFHLGGWPEADRQRCLADMITDYCSTPSRLPDAMGRLDAPVELADPGTVWMVVVELATAAERFIISHEIGHIVLGHEGYAVTRPSISAQRVVVESKNEPDQEIAADKWALDKLFLIAKASKESRYSIALAYSGALIFLGIESLVEAKLASLGAVRPASHPPATERLNRIRLESFREVLELHVQPDGNPLEMLAGLTQLVFGGLEQHTGPGEQFLALVCACHELMFGQAPELDLPLLTIAEPDDGPRPAVHDDDSIMACRGDGTIAIYTATRDSVDIKKQVRIPTRDIHSAAFSCGRAGVGTVGGPVHIIEDSGIESFGGIQSPVSAICFGPSGEYLYAGDEDGRLYAYILSPPFFRKRRKNKPLLIPVSGESVHDCVTGLAVDRQGEVLASVGLCGNQIRMWDTKHSTEVYEPLALENGIWFLVWTSRGLVSAGNEVAILWEVMKQGIIDEVNIGSNVTAHAVSKNGESLAIGTERGTVVCWPVAAPDDQKVIDLQHAIRGIAFSQDEERILVLDDKNKCEILQLPQSRDGAA